MHGSEQIGEREDYFDLQVNGYGGVDFNAADLTLEAVGEACASLARDGVAGVLATVISAAPEHMLTCVRNLIRFREADEGIRRLIAGLHIEGPFLSLTEGYRGAHPLAALGPANRDLAARLVEAGNGLVRLFTLAPEQDDGQVIGWLAGQGIVVAAGHTDASLDELRRAIDHGLTAFTHLGNGCPQMLPRHDNIIQRAVSLRAHLHFGLIADGVHVPAFAFRNLLDLIGPARCFVVTDAMAAAGKGPGRYRLGDWEIEVDEDLAVWAPNRAHLVGSAGTLRAAAGHLAAWGVSPEDIRALTRDNPRRLLKTA